MNLPKWLAIKFLVLVLLSMFVCGDEEVRCLEREREALLSFKDGLIDTYGALSSWQNQECCEWDGVVCSNTTGHVIRLQLDGLAVNFRLLGNISSSSSLLELHRLNFLDLSYNNFEGGRIPEFIGSMKQLQNLYLENSNFSGNIPPQLGNLTNLQILSLSDNYLRSENLDWLSSLSSLSGLGLRGSLDLSDAKLLQQIMNLPSLQILDLKSCNIGVVRPSLFPFVNSSSLSILDLSYNHLTLAALEWLPNLNTSLKRLSLSDNALDGQIPNAFERLHFLEYLDLSNNTLEGEISRSLGNLSHLQFLFLYHNELRGNVDSYFEKKIGSFVSLRVLDLTLNQLNGSVPDLAAFSSLRELYLARNRLTGPLPLSLGKLSNLRILDVSRNLLEGTVSESHLANLHNLKKLDLSSNSIVINIDDNWNPPFELELINLSGCKMRRFDFPKWIRTQKTLSNLDLSGCGIAKLPEWLWSFSPLLQYLFLSDNQINATLPSLSSTPIIGLDLSYNNISGQIPLFHPNTQGFQLSHNMFSGSISSLCEILHKELFFLDLSNNNLAGEIPDCWEKMPSIFYLNLANNTFSGEIPRSLGSSLQYLVILQLFGNTLSGEIPSTLRFCKKLQTIDVGGNELSGSIPAWLGYTKLVFLNFNGNTFSGSISEEICNLPYIQVLDFSRNNLYGEIPNCFDKFISLADTDTDYYFVGFRYIFRYNTLLGHFSYVRDFSQSSTVKWKRQEREYEKNLVLLKLIDFSSNRLTGNIPESFSSMRGLNSLNLSRNSLTGNIIPDIDRMEKLESLDLSNNQFSGDIPTSLVKLYSLGVLDLSNNNLSGKIPTGTQLQSFEASAYAGNDRLCGKPLGSCPEDSLRPPSTNLGGNVNEKDDIFSFMQEVGISMAFGFIVGFWGVVGSLILKKSWRIAFFNLFDDAKNWCYVRSALFLSKWR